MISNIIKLISVVLFFFSSVLHADETINHEPQISIGELQRMGSKYVGNNVSLVGFLMVDQGMFLYPDIDSFISYEVRASAYFTVFDYKKYASLSGCFVALVGKVGTHKTDKNVYLISDIKSIARIGYLYQTALKSGKSDPRCEMRAIVEAM